MEEDLTEEIVSTETSLLEKELEEEKQKYMYLAADFDNMKKRLNQQLEKERKFKNKDLIIKLLEVVDNCERSLEYNNNESPVYKQLMSVLSGEGVEKLNVTIGDTFDVNSMEAVSITHGNENLPHNSVSCVIKNGYSYNGEIIRFATVMVEHKEI